MTESDNGRFKDAAIMGATGTGTNGEGDGIIQHALYSANDLLDSGGSRVSYGPVGDTLGTCRLGTPVGLIGMDAGACSTNNVGEGGGRLEESHAEPMEGGLGPVSHGIVVSGRSDDVTAPRAIFVFPCSNSEPIPHGVLDADSGLQPFRAGAAHTTRKTVYGNT
jgi:hypothetical protein